MVIPPNNIGKSNGGPASSGQAGSVRSPAPQHAQVSPEGKAADTSDPVSLSPEAQKMAKVEAAISQHSGVDEAKVAALREAIAKGQYSVDSQSLSEKMLEMDEKFNEY